MSLSAETINAFNTGFNTVILHRPTRCRGVQPASALQPFPLRLERPPQRRRRRHLFLRGIGAGARRGRRRRRLRTRQLPSQLRVQLRLDIASQLEIETKTCNQFIMFSFKRLVSGAFNLGSTPYYSFKHLVPGAFNVCLIGSTCTAVPRGAWD